MFSGMSSQGYLGNSDLPCIKQFRSKVQIRTLKKKKNIQNIQNIQKEEKKIKKGRKEEKTKECIYNSMRSHHAMASRSVKSLTSENSVLGPRKICN